MFAPRSALLYVLASPISTFYRTGSSAAITLSATPDYVRAFPAGTGAHKIGANYAPCFLPQAHAALAGHAQNLWVLPTATDHLLQEVGTMNLFVVLEERGSGRLELATPPLASRTILPGVTRASVLELARERLDRDRYVVRERDVGMRELVGAAREGRLREIFGTGTAVVVAPVRGVEWEGAMVECAVAGGQGSVAETIKGWLEAIQFGEEESEWSVRVT
jgi:branched-chain amino acid aminotransferase